MDDTPKFKERPLDIYNRVMKSNADIGVDRDADNAPVTHNADLFQETRDHSVVSDTGANNHQAKEQQSTFQ